MANNMKNGQGEPRTNDVTQSFSPNMSYKPKVSNSPAFRAADMSYSPDIASQPFAVNTKEATNVGTSEVNQSFSPNMSYKLKVSNSPAFRAADMSYRLDIANEPWYSVNTKLEAVIFPVIEMDIIFPTIEMDNNMKNGQGNNMTNGQGKPERKAGANEVDMSYTPKVFHNPQAIISNGTVNQAFGADMSYSPDIEHQPCAENTKETGADKTVKKIVKNS